ncbi:MAG: hypothetical protein UR26_C0002G0194 [candidate division TM6 bacterium GW2011_GWF2_32_72]|nr:MAG: hypothetical protein UR26_C0002G0194 [candidate division TM6 bacterium GW2011_GWF2_32_72]
MNTSFSIENTLKQTLQTFKQNIGLMLYMGIVYTGYLCTISFFSIILKPIPTNIGDIILTEVISQLINSIITSVIYIGIFKICLNLFRKQPIKISDLFSQIKKLGNFFVANILCALIVIPGLILFIVPGLIILTTFIFFIPTIIDKNYNPIKALDFSKKLSQGNKSKLFFLLIIVFFGVGIFMLPFFILYFLILTKQGGLTEIALMDPKISALYAQILYIPGIVITPFVALLITKTYLILLEIWEQKQKLNFQQNSSISNPEEIKQDYSVETPEETEQFK